MKGYFSIEGVIALFISLLILLMMYPIIKENIQAIIPEMDNFTASLLSIVPAVWVVFLMLAILAFMPSSSNSSEGG